MGFCWFIILQVSIRFETAHISRLSFCKSCQISVSFRLCQVVSRQWQIFSGCFRRFCPSSEAMPNVFQLFTMVLTVSVVFTFFFNFKLNIIVVFIIFLVHFLNSQTENHCLSFCGSTKNNLQRLSFSWVIILQFQFL